MSGPIETKTITEFLAESPNVDVTKAFNRFWNILSGIKDRVTDRFDLELHPACEGRDYYTSPDGTREGAFFGYTGKDVDWFVHSWIGNRKASILDMNATVFLGQQTRVPHLILIFGTVPRVFFYADYQPRVDLRNNLDYMNKYYEPANEAYLKLRGDPRFTWAVSHGTYMRAIQSPVCVSVSAEMGDDVIDTLEGYATQFVDRWIGWLDDAEPVPEPERPAQQAFDYELREMGYRLDPMNVLVEPVFGTEEFNRMLELRMGKEQMDATRR